MADRERKSPAPVESNLRTRASSARAAFSASRAAWSFHSGEMSSMADRIRPPRRRELRAARQAVRHVLAAALARATAFRASSWSPSLERSVPYVNPSRCPVMTRRPIPFEDALLELFDLAVAHAHGSVAGPLGVRFRLGGAGLARELDQLFAGVEQVHSAGPP